MTSDYEHFYTLLHRYLSDEATKEEVVEMLDYLSSHSELYDEMMASYNDTVFFEKLNQTFNMPASASKRMLDRLLAEVKNEPGVENVTRNVKRMPIRMIRWVAAAIFVLFSAMSIYYWIAKPYRSELAKINTHQEQDLMPGKNGAILTLSNGFKIVLDSLGNGIVATQGGVQVQLNGGQLLYDESGHVNAQSGHQMTYNTMSTPKGRQFQIILCDGTKVWLNAGSSITYPTVFENHERLVTMTGEAYFEVVHKDKIPFRVKSGNKIIEVLGTHFNVNSYDDEPAMKTTLLEGSVRLDRVVLLPGQQAQINKEGKISVEKNIDVDRVIAWKNNLFAFSNADLHSVMRELSRWYDIEVVYQGKIPEREFEGKMEKSLTLSQMLRILDNQNVQYKIEGRKVIIMP